MNLTSTSAENHFLTASEMFYGNCLKTYDDSHITSLNLAQWLMVGISNLRQACSENQNGMKLLLSTNIAISLAIGYT